MQLFLESTFHPRAALNWQNPIILWFWEVRRVIVEVLSTGGREELLFHSFLEWPPSPYALQANLVSNHFYPITTDPTCLASILPNFDILWKRPRMPFNRSILAVCFFWNKSWIPLWVVDSLKSHLWQLFPKKNSKSRVDRKRGRHPV